MDRNLLTFLLLPVSRKGFSFITALLLRHLPAHLFIHVVGDLVRLLFAGLSGYLTARLVLDGAAIVLNTGGSRLPWNSLTMFPSNLLTNLFRDINTLRLGDRLTLLPCNIFAYSMWNVYTGFIGYIPTRLTRHIRTLLLRNIPAHLLGNIITGLTSNILTDGCWDVNTIFNWNILTNLILNLSLYNFWDVITNSS